ncbi:hypothetical protein [Ancylobacter defluvii]|uniref:Uncharacterized protein n=1 Tax=Ancylobacter defluvii TaxID=1282440 RepID=A0A9W6K1S5_9HYPH|nr:hypothetical protein [Ancylobacter defluvii]MBS7588250.1 hypothetical protein [Ancylobacter defluvii]GLK86646.1 hypothetical protein GCM10017653_47160 [Ancylobacter defluvii]
MSEPLFLVWNPRGATPPTVQHPNYQSASEEACRLAEKSPGQRFYILEAQAFAEAVPPSAILTEIQSDDDGDAEDRFGWSVEITVESPAAPTAVRVLQHGEYRSGDRVRFTGRKDAMPDLVGKVGVIIAPGTLLRPGFVAVVFDGDVPRHERAYVVSIENLEHESLPQFEVGDLVRAKTGSEGLVVPSHFTVPKWIAVAFPHRSGSFAFDPADLTLVRPARADAAQRGGR